MRLMDYTCFLNDIVMSKQEGLKKIQERMKQHYSPSYVRKNTKQREKQSMVDTLNKTEQWEYLDE